MPLDVAIVNQTLTALEPIYRGFDVLPLPVNLQPSTAFPQGQALGLVTTAVNDVQTLTSSGTPTSGNFLITGYWGGSAKLLTIAFDSTVAETQAALDDLIGPGRVTVGGSTLPDTTQTFTATGVLAHLPIQVATVSVASLAGGVPVASFAHTATGVTAAAFGKYDSTVLAAPTVAPTVVVGSGTSDPPTALSHLWSYTYYNAQGETTPSPTTSLASDGTHTPSISSIAVPSGATGIRYYVDGALFTSVTTAGAVTGTATLIAARTVRPPATNTAYTSPNGAGTETFKCLLKYACITDASGNITFGTATGGGSWQETRLAATAYFCGTFNTAETTGLDDKALADVGAHLLSGTLSAGVVEMA